MFSSLTVALTPMSRPYFLSWWRWLPGWMNKELTWSEQKPSKPNRSGSLQPQLWYSWHHRCNATKDPAMKATICTLQHQNSHLLSSVSVRIFQKLKIRLSETNCQTDVLKEWCCYKQQQSIIIINYILVANMKNYIQQYCQCKYTFGRLPAEKLQSSSSWSPIVTMWMHTVLINHAHTHTHTHTHTQNKKYLKRMQNSRVVLTRYNDIRGLLLFWDMRSIECPSSCFLFFLPLPNCHSFRLLSPM